VKVAILKRYRYRYRYRAVPFRDRNLDGD